MRDRCLKTLSLGTQLICIVFRRLARRWLYDPTDGLLQITNSSSQVATLDFQNSTLGTGSFSFASDGSGGIKITHS